MEAGLLIYQLIVTPTALILGSLEWTWLFLLACLVGAWPLSRLFKFLFLIAVIYFSRILRACRNTATLLYMAIRHPVNTYHAICYGRRYFARGYQFLLALRAAVDMMYMVCGIIITIRIFIRVWKFGKSFVVISNEKGEPETFQKLVERPKETRDKGKDIPKDDEEEGEPEFPNANLFEAIIALITSTIESFLTILAFLPFAAKPSMRGFVFFAAGLRAIRIVFCSETFKPFVEMFKAAGGMMRWVPGYTRFMQYLDVVKTKPKRFKCAKATANACADFIRDLKKLDSKFDDVGDGHLARLWKELIAEFCEKSAKRLAFFRLKRTKENDAGHFVFDSETCAERIKAFCKTHKIHLGADDIEEIVEIFVICAESIELEYEMYSGNSNILKRMWTHSNTYVIVALIVAILAFALLAWRITKNTKKVSSEVGIPEGKGKTKHGRGAVMRRRRPQKQLTAKEYDEWKKEQIKAEAEEPWDAVDEHDRDVGGDPFADEKPVFEDPKFATTPWYTWETKFATVRKLVDELGSAIQAAKPNEAQPERAKMVIATGAKQEEPKVQIRLIKAPEKPKNTPEARPMAVAPPKPSRSERRKSKEISLGEGEAFVKPKETPKVEKEKEKVGEPETYIVGSPLPPKNLHPSKHLILESETNIGNAFCVGQFVMTAHHNLQDPKLEARTYQDTFGKQPLSAKIHNLKWVGNEKLDYAFVPKTSVPIKNLRSYSMAVPVAGMPIVIPRFDPTDNRFILTSGVIDEVVDGILYHTGTTGNGDSGAAILNEAGQVVGIHTHGVGKGDSRNSGFAFTQSFINRFFPKGSSPSKGGE